MAQKKDSKKEEVKEIKMSDIKDDAVSKKTKVVDGEEVTEYTTKDGNVIQILQETKKAWNQKMLVDQALLLKTKGYNKEHKVTRKRYA